MLGQHAMLTRPSCRASLLRPCFQSLPHHTAFPGAPGTVQPRSSARGAGGWGSTAHGAACGHDPWAILDLDTMHAQGRRPALSCSAGLCVRMVRSGLVLTNVWSLCTGHPAPKETKSEGKATQRETS